MRLLKRSMILLIAFSSLSCANGLKITLCYSEPPHGLRCMDPKTKKFHWVKYEESKDFVALSQQDAKTLLEYLKTKCSK